MKDLIIENVGFDVEAMAKMPEDKFVETHMDNDAIQPHKSKEEKAKWLKDAYASIQTVDAANKELARAEEVKAKTDAQKAATASPVKPTDADKGAKQNGAEVAK
jgi:hypothetical protein